MTRLVRIAGPALLLVVGLLSLLVAMQVGGAASPTLVDPGATVRFGLPIAKLIVNLGAAGTIGTLVLTLFALTKGRPEFDRALDVVAGASAVWAVASAITGFFTFLSVYLQPLRFDAAFGELIGSFFTQVEFGQGWLATTLIAASTTVLAFAVRSRSALVFVTVFAVIGLVPMAIAGHSADAAGHDAAVTSLGLHLVFAALWLGGLLAIVLIRPTIEKDRIGAVLSRYSSIALVSFVVVAVSGYVNASLRINTLESLLNPYGVLVLVKVFALLALGVFGAVQRRSMIARMQRAENGGARWFWWLIVAELGVHGPRLGCRGGTRPHRPAATAGGRRHHPRVSPHR